MPERDLLVLSEEPLNAETKLGERTGTITPAGRHYVRTHFPVPHAPGAIAVDGAVGRPMSITFDEIRSLPVKTLAVTLECAGNGRRFLEPKVPGEQWGLGAVGTAEWTGAPLRALLERVAPDSKAVEVLFRGADEGVPKDLGRRIAYERSLPVAEAMSADVLVAHLMNGGPIPPEHGGPLRLVVPGWYGMASVKWLSRITVLEEPFVGFYQTDRYVLDRSPLRAIAPRAILTHPQDGTRHERAIWIAGFAWSGAAPITRVDLSTDGGESWDKLPDAYLEDSPRYAWRHFRFEHLLTKRSAVQHWSLAVRATDALGNTQPVQAKWNALGYANNAIRTVRVEVLG
ncbi:MAG TPA: sulfite oxidase [Candidatus Limnocylindria bacterium]|jgi:DMSO/TMAO reductase YedYZ molybdopterin-dependent catalytic subunit|nr:sulfite oxidase [Candidatus Limnocylindria bacterium]